MKHPRFRYKTTRSGKLFIALCLGMGVAALNSGNNLIYLIFSMMLSFIILSGILSNSTLLGLRLKSRVPKRVFAGEELATQVEIVNHKRRLPSFAVVLQAKAEDGVNATGAFVLKIPARQARQAFVRLTFAQRGWSSLPKLFLSTTYPFGFLNKYILGQSERSVLVLPSLVDVSHWWMEHRSSLLGEQLNQRKRDVGHPFGVRDFVQGDPYRRIHWKSSAKLAKLRVKEFEAEENREVHLHLQLVQEHESNMAWCEKAISLAASLVVALDQEGVPVSLSINGAAHYASNASLDQKLAALAITAPPAQSVSSYPLSEQQSHLLVTDSAWHHRGPFAQTISSQTFVGDL